MTLAYLMNTYPLTSTTFIRREIEAHERAGETVLRYALRGRSGTLVDPLDVAEIERTHYILEGNAAGLIKAFFKELVTNPKGLIRALKPWWFLCSASRWSIIPHAAYFLEAIYFKQRTARDGINHVHVHFLTNSTAVAMLSHLMGGPTYSATVHGPDELTDAPLLGFPEKIKHAKFIAAITDFCKSQLIRFSETRFADKIKIIHCALKLDEFEASPPPDNQTFVCVGRLCPQKGQAQLPAAVHLLKDEFPNLKVVLIGDGESRREIEEQIKAFGVESNFELKGWMANVDVREAVKRARAFLLPSYAEGLPVVIMEAFALGRPVISTYIAGIPELVDDQCGWIIPAGSTEKLSAAMRAGLRASPDELAQKGAEGRARIERFHDVDKEAESLRVFIEG